MITPEELKEWVNRWARIIGVKPLEIHVRRMSRKWASCSSRGRITINSEIMKHPKKFIDKVIVHELLHLKYPNHGKMFQALMRGYLNEFSAGARPRVFKACKCPIWVLYVIIQS